jgi:probable HAF family extracellular repeat protein
VQRKLSIAPFFLLFMSGQIAKPDSYTFSSISVPNSFQTQAIDINNLGQISGWYSNSAGAYGFIDTNGSFTSIDGPHAPGDINNRVAGINNLGQVVGFVINDPGGSPTGFLDANGSITTINFPGTTYTLALGINDTGQIVGYYSDGSREHGFLRNAAGAYMTFDYPGSSSTSVSGINDLGQIVGAYSDGTGAHSFLYSNGVFTTLPDIAGFGAYGINDIGQIVGTSGVLNPDGSFTPIAGPGYIHTVSVGINDSGQVVGYGNDATDRSISFLATPAAAAPEPQELPIVAVALACLPILRRYKRCPK